MTDGIGPVGMRIESVSMSEDEKKGGCGQNEREIEMGERKRRKIYSHLSAFGRWKT